MYTTGNIILFFCNKINTFFEIPTAPGNFWVNGTNLAPQFIAIRRRCSRKPTFLWRMGRFAGIMAIPHNSKCRCSEREVQAAKQKAQIILDAAKVSAASGGYSEPKQGQRSQSARGFCPRSTMRVPQPDIIEHFCNADCASHTEPQRGASERNRRLRRLLARRSAAAVLKPSGGNCAVLPMTKRR